MSSMKMSSIALSPRLSKNEVDPYLTSNFERSTSILAVYKFLFLVMSKVMFSVLPLMVSSALTDDLLLINFEALVTFNLAVGNLSTPKKSSDFR